MLFLFSSVSAQEDAVEDEVVTEEGEDSKVEAEEEEPAAEETSPTGKVSFFGQNKFLGWKGC